jgi:FkbM family methyltransferase
MSCDLSEWGGRACYYWGRYYDATHQAVLRRFLHAGDTYIDVGANLGFHSVFACRLVGPAGAVFSFEPHPESWRVLNAHLAINRIRHCRTFNVALGDCDIEATLWQGEQHPGTATLRSGNGDSAHGFSVPVRRGDSILRETAFGGQVVVKIDVEGFEHHVVRGLWETLQRVDVACMEVTPEWLAKQGTSAAALYRGMFDLGFHSYLPELHWNMGLFSPSLSVAPITVPPPQQHDVLFSRRSCAMF